MAKFFWLLVLNRVSRNKTDKVPTWDRVIMVAALAVGLEIDFARMMFADIHERDLRPSTITPFCV